RTSGVPPRARRSEDPTAGRRTRAAARAPGWARATRPVPCAVRPVREDVPDPGDPRGVEREETRLGRAWGELLDGVWGVPALVKQALKSQLNRVVMRATAENCWGARNPATRKPSWANALEFAGLGHLRAAGRTGVCLHPPYRSPISP